MHTYMHAHAGHFRLHIPHLSRRRFLQTTGWSLLFSALIVAIAATLARATLSLGAALTEKPDLAVYLLLRERGVRESVLLRSEEFGAVPQRDYFVETADGPRLVQLRKGYNDKWYVANVEDLRETGGSEQLPSSHE